MANLKLSHIYKVYDNGHKAVNDFCIDIKDKEFIVFVGPSGCGKSTTLRMIAGLENITAGDLFIGDTLVNDMEPKDRDIAMVFQNYALYPHMSVYENMAFGLRNRHVPEEEIKEKVIEAAKILDITDYLDRKPKAMSGGQRQRVALGRAIVRDPKVFLLDEPLSNLDAKLRAEMRTQITKLHKRLGTTFIYVTHDQVEAMTMGTRIVVMKLGYVQQIDKPMNLYNKPYNKFVAGFIGTPQMNFFDVTLNRVGEEVELKFVDGSVIKVPYEYVCKAHENYLHGDVKVIFGIRPEHIALSDKETGLKCAITSVEHLGNESILYGDLGQSESEFTMKDEGKSIIIKTTQDTNVEVGDIVNLEVNPEKIHLFDSETEITLIEDIPEFNLVNAKVNGANFELLNSKHAICPIFAPLVDGKDQVKFEIPPAAIVPGKDFKLPVDKIEDLENDKHLAYLRNGDSYLFALVDESVKAGDNYNFTFLNDKVRLLVDNEVALEPVGEKEQIRGSFKMEQTGRNSYKFYYGMNDFDVLAEDAAGYKINSVEGSACYKKTYKYVFLRDAISFSNEGISARVKDILDYSNRKYALLDVNGQDVKVLVDDAFNETLVKLSIPGNAVEVWQEESDFRIC
ncbi:MAG: sn-glycerol-3-phosphate ABC transporter ATP-binding protein UgpC [Gammaproteobacteria bacterium]|nr:sn-glycerol-3-phosphate ABC transporter ATP-binding protein UgpC [Gammaproteobacteria bacterium]